MYDEPICTKCNQQMFFLGDFKATHVECGFCGFIIVPEESDIEQVIEYQLRESNRTEAQLRVQLGLWNAGDIPRKKSVSDGEVLIEISDVYMLGTTRLKKSRSEEELEEYIQGQGIRSLPDGSVAVDPIMTIEQCREMFRTNKYPKGLGKVLGFTMRE